MKSFSFTIIASLLLCNAALAEPTNESRKTYSTEKKPFMATIKQTSASILIPAAATWAYLASITPISKTIKHCQAGLGTAISDPKTPNVMLCGHCKSPTTYLFPTFDDKIVYPLVAGFVGLWFYSAAYTFTNEGKLEAAKAAMRKIDQKIVEIINDSTQLNDLVAMLNEYKYKNYILPIASMFRQLQDNKAALLDAQKIVTILQDNEQYENECTYHLATISAWLITIEKGLDLLAQAPTLHAELHELELIELKKSLESKLDENILRQNNKIWNNRQHNNSECGECPNNTATTASAAR